MLILSVCVLLRAATGVVILLRATTGVLLRGMTGGVGVLLRATTGVFVAVFSVVTAGIFAVVTSGAVFAEACAFVSAAVNGIFFLEEAGNRWRVIAVVLVVALQAAVNLGVDWAADE